MGVPQLLSVNAFDASFEYTFKFTYDGNQIRKTRLQICNNQTNAVVFNQTIDNYQAKHTLPANTLTNGTLYNVAIECFDKDNHSSGLSNKVIFYCFTTPSFKFSNITNGLIIGNSNITPSLTYSQIEGELLNSYQFILYNHNKVQINQSGIKYNTSSMTTNFSNLEETNYFIRAIGETVNGMLLDTGFIGFSVVYDSPNNFSLLEVTNLEHEGRIKIKSNIIGMSGRTLPEDAELKFIDNEMLDLTNTNTKVIFDKGFSLNDDFEFDIVWYGEPIYNETFFEFEDIYKNKIILSWRLGTYESNNNIEKTFIKLETEKTLKYMILSNFIDKPLSTQKTEIYIRRINHVFELYIKSL